MNQYDDDADDQSYPYEDHLEGIVSEGVEYMLLRHIRDDKPDPEKRSAAVRPFLRRMLRTLRSCADRMEVRVAFLEEKAEEGLTDEQAEQEFFKHFFDEDDSDE